MKHTFLFLTVFSIGAIGCTSVDSDCAVDVKFFPCRNVSINPEVDYQGRSSAYAPSGIAADTIMWITCCGDSDVRVYKYATDISFEGCFFELKNDNGDVVKCMMRGFDRPRTNPAWFEAIHLKRGDSICAPISFDRRIWTDEYPVGCHGDVRWKMRPVVCGRRNHAGKPAYSNNLEKLGQGEWILNGEQPPKRPIDASKKCGVAVTLAYNPFWRSSEFQDAATVQTGGYGFGGWQFGRLHIHAFAKIENHTERDLALNWHRNEPWRCFYAIELLDGFGNVRTARNMPLTNSSEGEVVVVPPGAIQIVPIPISDSLWNGFSDFQSSGNIMKLRILLRAENSGVLLHKTNSDKMEDEIFHTIASNWMDMADNRPHNEQHLIGFEDEVCVEIE